VFFCKRWAPFFQLQTLGATIKQRWAPFLPGLLEILPRFLGILPGFSTNQNFWGCACTRASYTTGDKQFISQCICQVGLAPISLAVAFGDHSSLFASFITNRKPNKIYFLEHHVGMTRTFVF